MDLFHSTPIHTHTSRICFSNQHAFPHKTRSHVAEFASWLAAMPLAAMPTNATAMAWGRGVHSQLGIRLDADGEEMKPQPALQTVPQPALGLPQAERAVLIATGETFTVLVTSRGATYVCGSNGDGELADARNSDGSMLGMCSRPHRALLKHDILRVACGARHAIALSAAGAAFAWGRNSSGQLGLGHTSAVAKPTEVPRPSSDEGEWLDAAAGAAHSLGSFRRAGDERAHVYSWGEGAGGCLGHGDATPTRGRMAGKLDRYTPTEVAALRARSAGCVQLASSSRHVLVLLADHTVLAFGLVASGRLGVVPSALPSLDDFRCSEPRVVMGALHGQAVVMVAAGGAHSAALAVCGACSDVFVWGANGYGQLGLGGGASAVRAVNTPLRCPSLCLPARPVVWIGCGESYTVVQTLGGMVLCMGDNGDGQCGQGPHVPSMAEAVPVALGATALLVAAGSHHAAAIMPPVRSLASVERRQQLLAASGSATWLHDSPTSSFSISAELENDREARDKLRARQLEAQRLNARLQRGELEPRHAHTNAAAHAHAAVAVGSGVAISVVEVSELAAASAAARLTSPSRAHVTAITAASLLSASVLVPGPTASAFLSTSDAIVGPSAVGAQDGAVKGPSAVEAPSALNGIGTLALSRPAIGPPLKPIPTQSKVTRLLRDIFDRSPRALARLAAVQPEPLAPHRKVGGRKPVPEGSVAGVPEGAVAGVAAFAAARAPVSAPVGAGGAVGASPEAPSEGAAAATHDASASSPAASNRRRRVALETPFENPWDDEPPTKVPTKVPTWEGEAMATTSGAPQAGFCGSLLLIPTASGPSAAPTAVVEGAPTGGRGASRGAAKGVRSRQVRVRSRQVEAEKEMVPAEVSEATEGVRSDDSPATEGRSGALWLLVRLAHHPLLNTFLMTGKVASVGDAGALGEAGEEEEEEEEEVPTVAMAAGRTRAPPVNIHTGRTRAPQRKSTLTVSTSAPELTRKGTHRAAARGPSTTRPSTRLPPIGDAVLGAPKEGPCARDGARSRTSGLMVAAPACGSDRAVVVPRDPHELQKLINELSCGYAEQRGQPQDGRSGRRVRIAAIEPKIELEVEPAQAIEPSKASQAASEEHEAAAKAEQEAAEKSEAKVAVEAAAKAKQEAAEKATIAIQARVRTSFVANGYRNELKARRAAAMIMQASYRGHTGRSAAAKQLRVEVHAAALVQALMRGRAERNLMARAIAIVEAQQAEAAEGVAAAAAAAAAEEVAESEEASAESAAKAAKAKAEEAAAAEAAAAAAAAAAAEAAAAEAAAAEAAAAEAVDSVNDEPEIEHFEAQPAGDRRGGLSEAELFFGGPQISPERRNGRSVFRQVARQNKGISQWTTPANEE